MIQLMNAIDTLKKVRKNFIEHLSGPTANAISKEYVRGFEDALGLAITIVDGLAERYANEYESEHADA